MRATAGLAAAVNLAIGIGALVLSRQWARVAGKAAPHDAGEHQSLARAPSEAAALRLAFYGTAIAGMGALALEMLWMRGITIAVGNSAYSFSVMLAAFLVGIAIGSTIHAAFPLQRLSPALQFGSVMILLGVASAIVSQLLPHLPSWSLSLTRALYTEPNGIRAGGTLLLSFAIMLAPCIFMGLAFPMAGEAGSGTTAPRGPKGRGILPGIAVDRGGDNGQGRSAIGASRAWALLVKPPESRAGPRWRRSGRQQCRRTDLCAVANDGRRSGDRQAPLRWTRVTRLSPTAGEARIPTMQTISTSLLILGLTLAPPTRAAPPEVEMQEFRATVSSVRLSRDLVERGKSLEEEVAVTVPAILFPEPLVIPDVRTAKPHEMAEVNTLVAYTRANMGNSVDAILAFWAAEEREEKARLLADSEILKANRDYHQRDPGLEIVGVVFQESSTSVLLRRFQRVIGATVKEIEGKLYLTDMPHDDVELAIIEASFAD